MSDTIVVTAPNPAIDSPSYGGGGMTFSVPHMPGCGQIFMQSTYGWFNGPAFPLEALTFLEKYIKEHGASDPLTLQIVANNIRYFCNADRNLVLHPGGSVYDAYTASKPVPNKYDYRSMNIKELSGSVTSPVVALAHYLWGEGQERSVNLANIGLKVAPTDIPAIMSIVNSGVVGTFPISSNFVRDTFNDNIATGAYLGNITMKTEGTLTIASGGSWNYTGTLRSYNDKYDFNPSNHRGPIAESLTRFLGMYSGKTYTISIPGTVSIKGSGKR